MQNTSGKPACDAKIAGLYDLGETLGSGHFANVKLARHVFTGEQVAVKVVDKTKLDDISRSHLFQEVRCMKLVQHPHVVRLYEVIDTQTKLYLVLELGDGGDLYDYIMKHDGGLSEDLARKYFGQIVRAISYCHQLHVVHRDLKPENVVFFEKLGIVKLTDFGFSNKFCPGQKLETSCGSLAYSAPEILLGDSYDAPAVDVWSLGVILYMLVCGSLPFENANDSETLTMIMDCKYTMPSYLSPECKQLISTMLVREPENRSTLEEISANDWLRLKPLDESPDYQPLVSHQQVNEEDHKFIIQKMINGNVATKEDILQSLDRDKYNHITATYFLLAERKLRQNRNEQKQLEADAQNKKEPQFEVACGTFKPVIKPLLPVKTENRSTLCPVIESWAMKRSRKCSIVKEEDDEDEISESCESNTTRSRRGSRSEGRLNKAVQQAVSEIDIGAFRVNNSDVNVNGGRTSNNAGTTISEKKPDNSLNTILSNMKILQESEKSLTNEKNSQKLRIKHKNPMLTNRRNKIIQIRTPSCSSSEASDDENKSRKKKNYAVSEAPSRFRFYRQDSHDDSSDSQDQTNYASSPGNSLQYVVCSSSTSDKEKGSTSQDNCGHNGKPRHTNTKQKRHHNYNEQAMLSVKQKKSDLTKHMKSLDKISEAFELDAKEHKSIVIEEHITKLNLNSNSKTKRSEKALTKATKTFLRRFKATHDKPICNFQTIIFGDELNKILANQFENASLLNECGYSEAIANIGKFHKYIN